MPELQVVLLAFGPLDGDQREAPVDMDQIWCEEDGSYHEYTRLNPVIFTYSGVTKTREELVEWLAAQGAEPWLHMDEDPPRARNQPVRRIEHD